MRKKRRSFKVVDEFYASESTALELKFKMAESLFNPETFCKRSSEGGFSCVNFNSNIIDKFVDFENDLSKENMRTLTSNSIKKLRELAKNHYSECPCDKSSSNVCDKLNCDLTNKCDYKKVPIKLCVKSQISDKCGDKLQLNDTRDDKLLLNDKCDDKLQLNDKCGDKLPLYDNSDDKSQCNVKIGYEWDMFDGKSQYDAKDNGFLHLYTEEGIVFVPRQSWSEVVEKCRGIYTMRMLEGSAGAADSDSAVSSMGSERVPSLTSDTDWMETNSDSGHTPADHFMAASTDLHSKLRWFDYNYCRQHSGEQGGGNSHRMPPVAQKKYHLFGKRLFSEQPSGNSGPAVPTGSGSSPGSGSTSGAGTSTNLRNSLDAKFDYNSVGVATPSLQPVYEHPSSPLDMVKPPPQEVKYSCSLEFARQNHCSGVRMSPSEAAVHNHSYPLPPDLPPGHLGILQRPLTRDKRTGKRGLEDISISRDERRARALNIPISVHDIINLPMDEFNERLSKFDLSETQLSLIRDIRRRGKNKVAAQNCRKRKLDQILSLADEVKMFREKKQRLLMERDSLLQERMRVKSTVAQLFRHIFQSLRDEDGNSYSPHEWSLEEALDGSIVLVPRGASDLTTLRHHLPSNSTRSEDRDLHQPSTSKKELDPRKHLP